TSTPPDVRELEEGGQRVAALAAYTPTVLTLAGGGGEPERVAGARVSPALFAVLGVSAQLGRAFLAGEGAHGAHRVLLLSDGAWRRRFGADPRVVGRAVTINREPFTIVGVMPPAFRFPDREAELWIPLAFAPGDPLNTRGNYFLQIVGRLRPGVTVARAAAELSRIAARVAAEHPGAGIRGVHLVRLRAQIIEDVRTVLLTLLGAVGLVLLIACGNLANLLLARGAARRKEIALRVGLGASGTRIARQLLTESLLLGVLGGVAGALVAVAGVPALARLAPAELPRVDEITVGGRALGVALFLALVTAVGFGLAPALQASRADVAGALREGGRGSAGISRRRVRDTLVAAQMALSIVLLVGAGLLIRSLVQVTRVEPGFHAEHLLTMSIALPESEYASVARTRVFFDALLARVRALPGVRSAAATSALSLGGGYWGKVLSIAGRPTPAEMPTVGYRVVSADYFRTMGVVLRRGRDFSRADGRGGPGAAVINDVAARRFFSGADPIGATIWLGPPESMVAEHLPPGYRFPRLQIVGVVASERFAALDVEPGPEVYEAYEQITERPDAMFLAVRGDAAPTALAAAVRAAVRELDAHQPVADIATMTQLVRQATAGRRFTVGLLGGFAALALALAGVGLYGVVSYAVAQRRREFGIRIALGAAPARILAQVVGRGLVPVVVGAALGLAGALALSRVLGSMLFGVPSTDLTTFAAVTLLLFGVAAVASLAPAWRAARVPPMETLRAE
ncbi:MAG: ABC transporter permease, partial [Gemmatimonadaceae bacterium]